MRSAPLRLIVNNKVSPHNFWVASGEEQQTQDRGDGVLGHSRSRAPRLGPGSRTRLHATSAPTGVAFLASRRRSELLPQNAERADADTPTFSNDVA